MSAPARRVLLSGLQRTVLEAYRECLRAAKRLPSPGSAAATERVRREFRVNATALDRFDHQRIEHLVRSAHKQVALMSRAGTVGVSTMTPRRL
jgi:hypothetical protein